MPKVELIYPDGIRKLVDSDLEYEDGKVINIDEVYYEDEIVQSIYPHSKSTIEQESNEIPLNNQLLDNINEIKTMNLLL